MSRNLKKVSAKSIILWVLVSINIIAVFATIYNIRWISLLAITLVLALLAVRNLKQKRHTLLTNFPLLGYFRYLLESIRPEIRQYFGESDLDGKPFSRRQRSIVYQRAKNVKQTVAFGMQEDSSRPGYEWVAHSVFPVPVAHKSLRTTIGNYQCAHPYDASILNIGAMSYGALSKTAISSLNAGALLGHFAHNTGEGGISEYHLSGGDLIWQIGTGYFGCRDEQGKFNAELFSRNAARAEVKMIELKLSQGAKPGHGGILPAGKNTPEIAAIRNVAPGTTVFSPPAHNAFQNETEMIGFIGALRRYAQGKPVGFKLCIGDKEEFLSICNAIRTTGIIPDFITIDGAEGGTGAAPLEFTDSIGMPLYEALAFVIQTLKDYDLKQHIKVIAAGKIVTAFDILKVLALGADSCYSARGMMFSLGCIQALQCDSGHCPVGIATQDRNLYKGLSVTDKKVRVANFHKNTIEAVAEMMEACGFRSATDIKPEKFFRKIDYLHTRNFKDIYFHTDNEITKENWTQPSVLN